MLYVCRVTLQQVLSGGEDELLVEKCLSVSVLYITLLPYISHIHSIFKLMSLCKHGDVTEVCATVYHNANTDPLSPSFPFLNH